MSPVARWTVSVLALIVALFFATGVYADDFTITFTGTPVPQERMLEIALGNARRRRFT